MPEENTKQELLEMILSAGLLEDLLKYLKEKRIDLDDIKSIYDIDESIIREYAKKKKIVISSDTGFDSKDHLEEDLEPREIRPKTPPRKKG